MIHLFVCREFPPAPHPPGGIGTYVEQMSRLLAEAGEAVHVIAHRWEGASDRRVSLFDGRLIIHRIALDDDIEGVRDADPIEREIRIGLIASSCPAQAFSWQAARLAERLVDEERIEVIEAQEWEAPLYYFLLRRRLGLAQTNSEPPCVVHLHSPTARIFEANRWDTTISDYAPMVAMEAFTIRNADALLSPSRYVADQVSADYRVARDRITVIPYPLGAAPRVARTSDVWSSGSICHVGRVEGRKGLAEWAAAVVAAGDRSVRIELAGGDTPVNATGGPTVGREIRRQLPPDWKRQFHFLGTLDRRGVQAALGRAWAAVVPSRWENFPYSSIEAMASGLPIIASPEGGMRELIEDGVSGWIAADASPDGLAAALRRALDTPPHRRAAMGEAAASRVHAICDSRTIVPQHLAFKQRIAEYAKAPAVRSTSACGVALVILDRPHSEFEALRVAIAAQTVAPSATTLVSSHPSAALQAMCAQNGWTIADGDRNHARLTTEISALFAADDQISAVALLDARLLPATSMIEVAGALFDREADCGLMSGWLTDPAHAHVSVPDDPSRPHVVDSGRTNPFLVVGGRSWQRAIADLGETPRLESVVQAVADRDGGLTWPSVLCTAPASIVHRRTPRRYSAMARAIQRPHVPLLKWFFDATPEDRRELLTRAVRNPGRLARQLAASLTQPRSSSRRRAGRS